MTPLTSTQVIFILCSLAALIIIHIPLWWHYSDCYRHGGMLQLASQTKLFGRLTSNYDFYCSWRKHPLQLTEYTGFIQSLGLVLRLLRLPPLAGALTFQFILTLSMATFLSTIMPVNLMWLPFIASACCIAPLYLSLTIMPDMYIMTIMSFVLALLYNITLFPPLLLAVLLGSAGWLSLRVKSSGFILSTSIVCSLPFLSLNIWHCILTLAITFMPLVLDQITGKDNTINQLLFRQLKYFGYTTADNKEGISPDSIAKRKTTKRLYSMTTQTMSGIRTALNPWHKFSFYRSNGLLYLTGVTGLTIWPLQASQSPLQPVYTFSYSYIFLFLLFHSQIGRYFHFASRAGGTLFPLWLLGTGVLFSQPTNIAAPILITLLGVEAYRSSTYFLPPLKSIFFEPPLTDSKKGDKVTQTLQPVLLPNDLLMLTYHDLNYFGLALKQWQIPIELEKTTAETMCKYIDYYRYDKRYRRIFLILPPEKALFLDKNLTPHFIEEEPLFSRFTELYGTTDLNGYRIFEATRPTLFPDLSMYETKTPNQLLNNEIIFKTSNKTCTSKT